MRTRLHQGNQEGWHFTKLFAEGSYAASGRLQLSPGGRKPVKSVKDNSYVRINLVYDTMRLA
jgi:hypothetical protein